MKKIKILLFVMVLLVSSSGLFAAEKITGLQIIENVYERPTGEDMEADLEMVLINKRGGERIRKIKQYAKDYGDVEKKIMYFAHPANIRNTSFVNWSYDAAGKNDDQWIYLPALKKIKRISSDSKGDYFMGSDFTYDDLGDRKPGDDKHKLLREETLASEDCYVVESIPKEEDYMYSKTVTWVIKDKWIGLKKDFYDEDGDYLKTLKIKKHAKVNNYWLLLETEMHNVQTEHKTKMSFTNVEIDQGIADKMFTERMMRRGLR
jgi:outer membrane lipoprotein-sorting protein